MLRKVFLLEDPSAKLLCRPWGQRHGLSSDHWGVREPREALRDLAG